MVKKMMLVALWCIQMKPSDRPSMNKVIEMLEGNIEQLHMPPKPFLNSQSMQVENNGMNKRNSNLSDRVFDFSYFCCPSTGMDDFSFNASCLSGGGHEVYIELGNLPIKYVPMISCRKMYDILSIPIELGNFPFYQTADLQLKWPQRICGKCEAAGMFCRFKSNSTSDELECFNPINIGGDKNGRRSLVSGGDDGCELLIASVTLVSFVLLVILIQKYRFHRQKKIKRNEHLKIERFLEDYRALKPARYTYADIKKITNQFKDKVGQGGYGIVYRGQLSNDVHVAVKILNNTKGNGEEFINEVGIIEKFASSDHEKHLLGWKKLQEIAMGIAKGIEYLHQGCDQQILHFDIKPHNILLDKNLNPKITDFGQAKLCSKEQSVVSMTTARGTIGYIAPEVFSRNFGNVSYKSDIYSFGMLLLEMVGGKENFNVMVNSTDQIYFPEWIYNRLDGGKEVGIRIQDEEDAKIAKKLAIVGLWCIQWYPVDRPSMHVVIQMLEGDGGTLIKPPNPFASTTPIMVTGQASVRRITSELEVIAEFE
ncbi:hypothetical protein Vadar_022230 [Vaccinium darrowii]|uniref:Uncharacterized protein n=1 Tax=Vaccinium darrowii TaxID=229202 RepID=A0ACB7YNI2_9ERIC|nr:hypothetical protein Vadar_022230 [Vaccinium darrowii]